MQADKIVSLFLILLMEVGQDADNFGAENIEPHVLVGVEQSLPRNIGNWRAFGQPALAAGIRKVEVQPEPAIAAADVDNRGLNRNRLCGAIPIKAVGPDDADIGRLGQTGMGHLGHAQRFATAR